MKLTPPKQTTFWISVVLAVLGLLGFMAIVPQLAAYAFWLVLVGFVVLALANMVKGW